MRMVLDANVWLSGIPRLRDQDSPPRKLIAAWVDGAFDVVISDHIIGEVTRSFQKPYFAAALQGSDAINVFNEIRHFAEVIEVDSQIPVTRIASDPEDDYVLATVVIGNADYLVTGDKQLQKLAAIGDAAILSPAEMLRVIETMHLGR